MALWTFFHVLNVGVTKSSLVLTCVSQVLYTTTSPLLLYRSPPLRLCNITLLTHHKTVQHGKSL